MTQTTNAGTATAMPDKRLVVDLVAFEYPSIGAATAPDQRRMAADRMAHYAVCQRTGKASRSTCNACPVRAQCLTAALAVDDPAEWRVAVNRAEREELWERLETAFNELRDRDFMRLDRLADGRGIG